MPTEPAAEVMSGATEQEILSESLAEVTTEEQASGTDATPESTPEQPAEQIDWRARLKEDPAFAEFVNAQAQSISAKLQARAERAQRRADAQEVVTATDGVELYDPIVAKAVSLARHVASEPDETDDTLPAYLQPDFAENDQQARRSLDATYTKFSEEAKALHAEHAKEWDSRYTKDPIAFAQWVEEETLNARIENRAKKMALSLAPAIAESESNQRLRTLATPLVGGTGAGTDDATFLADYAAGRSQDHARSRTLLRNLT